MLTRIWRIFKTKPSSQKNVVINMRRILNKQYFFSDYHKSKLLANDCYQYFSNFFDVPVPRLLTSKAFGVKYFFKYVIQLKAFKKMIKLITLQSKQQKLYLSDPNFSVVFQKTHKKEILNWKLKKIRQKWFNSPGLRQAKRYENLPH